MTAVEQFEAHLIEYGFDLSLHKFEIQTFKAMEKEQMINSFNQGYTQCSIEDLKPTSRDRYVDAEDYINKTFKSE